MRPFYLSNPNSSGVFVVDLKREQFVDGVSLYKFEPFKDEEGKAHFSLHNVPNVYQRISENWDALVLPVCESDSYPEKRIDGIETVAKGVAELSLKSGNWRMVQKAKIKYTESDAPEWYKALEKDKDRSSQQKDKEKRGEAPEEVKPKPEHEPIPEPEPKPKVDVPVTLGGKNEPAGNGGGNEPPVEPIPVEPELVKLLVGGVINPIEDGELYSDVDFPDERGTVEIKHKPMSAIAKIFTKKKLCPYCFSAYTINRAEYKKKDTRFICPDDPDDNKRELPYTHRHGKSKDLYFAVFGAENADKSCYLAVLIDTIKRRLTEAFRVNLQSLDDYTWDTYAEEYYNPIFKASKVAQVNVDAKKPLLYSLSFMKPTLFGKEKPADVNTLAFFDVDIVGETSEAGKRRKKDRYVNGIILLIDPLQLPKVREMLKLPAISGKSAEETVINVAKLIREEAPKSYGDPDKKIDIPIAIALSKIDMLKDKLGEDKQFLFCGGKHDGCFDQADAENVGDAIELLIGDLVSTVDSRFSDYGFFGISALGSEPIGSDIPVLEPIRVEDPFLWLLHKRGVIKGKKV